MKSWISACLSSNASKRSTNAARRSFPSPAASRCCTRKCRRSCEGIIARKKFVILCTNALLLDKRMDEYEPNPYFTWDIHLDGDKEMHDAAVDQKGVYDRAVKVLKKAKERGFRVCINTTLFNNADPERVAKFFDDVTAMGIDGIMTSPGYAYERAPGPSAFPEPQHHQEPVPRRSSVWARARNGSFGQSPLFMDFLAGNQTYHCTPWGNPTRNYFGWQKPLLSAGRGLCLSSFKELMENHRLGQIRRRQLREMR